VLVLLLSPKREARYGTPSGTYREYLGQPLSLQADQRGGASSVNTSPSRAFRACIYSSLGLPPFHRLVIACPVPGHCHGYRNHFARSLHRNGLDTTRTKLTGPPAFIHRTVDK
jgi:hypothetical protein